MKKYEEISEMTGEQYTSSDIERTDWGQVKNVFKNENYYRKELIDDIIKELNKHTLNSADISVCLCNMPEEPNSEPLLAIQYIKTSFLETLQYNKDIKGLKIDYEYDSDNDVNYIDAKFTVNDLQKFKTKAISYEMKVADIKDNLDRKKLLEKFKIKSGYLNWNAKKIPFQGGEGSVMSLFIKHATFVLNGRKIEGIINRRSDFQDIGNFSKDTIRDTFASIRAKITENDLPMKIINHSKGYYFLEISL